MTTATLLSFSCGSLVATLILFPLFAIREYRLRRAHCDELTVTKRTYYDRGYEARALVAMRANSETKNLTEV